MMIKGWFIKLYILHIVNQPVIYLCKLYIFTSLKLTKSSDTQPESKGPTAAPNDPIPSIIAPTVALALWLSLRDL